MEAASPPPTLLGVRARPAALSRRPFSTSSHGPFAMFYWGSESHTGHAPTQGEGLPTGVNARWGRPWLPFPAETSLTSKVSFRCPASGAGSGVCCEVSVTKSLVNVR